MPSSSLILRSCATLFTVSSFLSSAAAQTDYVYTLETEYSGTSFFENWDFFDQADPNHGFVTYVDETTANTDGLIGFNNGNPVMRVDSTNQYNASAPYYGNNGYGRPSVRITSKESFGEGLFIASIQHMPGGQCGTWPAFWTWADDGNWPYSGEIDIVEGVNNRQYSLAALHTGYECTISGDSRTMTGTLQSNDCQYDVATGSNGAGCDILDNDTGSYGAGLNSAGGAVVAMEWQSTTGIKIWSFDSGSVPADITAGTPDPSTWGLPAQFFDASANCDIATDFAAQKIVFNTNFCGDFGSAVWSSEGCAAQTGYDSCVSYVAENPAAFDDAYWQIGYVRYYQQVAATTTSTTTTVSSVTSVVSVSPTSETTAVASVTTVSVTSVSVSAVLVDTTTAIVSNGKTETITSSVLVSSSVTVTTVSSITLSLSGSQVEGSPLLITTSAAAATSATTTSSLTSLTSAVPQSSVLIAPMGSGVAASAVLAQTAGWDSWATASIPVVTSSPAATTTWSDWSNYEGTTTTIQTTWLEPCETGFTTRTTYIITTHCGCTETPVPTIPMKVVTTTCPESWGFTTPVIMTVPAPPTMTPTPATPAQQTWSTWDADSIIAEIATQSWPAWTPDSEGSTAVDTWSVWKPEATLPPLITPSGWTSWSASSSSSSSSSSWSAWEIVVSTQEVVPVPPTAAASTWETYVTSTSPAVATTTWAPVSVAAASSSSSSSSQGWNGANIAQYKGAADRISIGGSMVVGIVLAVVALLL